MRQQRVVTRGHKAVVVKHTDEMGLNSADIPGNSDSKGGKKG